MMSADEDELAWDVASAAQVCKVSERTIRRWITAGWLPVVRPGNKDLTTLKHIVAAEQRAKEEKAHARVQRGRSTPCP